MERYFTASFVFLCCAANCNNATIANLTGSAIQLPLLMMVMYCSFSG